MKLGGAIFVLSIKFPAVEIPLVAAFHPSLKLGAYVSGALPMGADAFDIVAIAVMGNPAFSTSRAESFCIAKVA